LLAADRYFQGEIVNVKALRITTLQIFVPALLTLALVLSGCSIPFVQKTLTDLQKVERQFPVAVEIVNTLVNFAAPEYAAQVTAISAQIKGDLDELERVLVNYRNNLQGATPGDLEKIQALATAIQSQLPQILPALHVTDPESVKYAGAVVGAINTVLAEIAALLPAGTAPAFRPTTEAALPHASQKIITETQLRAQFNAGQHKVRI
jgi:hypothetical protein